MAKKKTTISIEERLQQALVPKEEQPYEVPGNWVWSYTDNMVNIFRGVSYNKNEAHTVPKISDCLILRGGNITEGDLVLDTDDNVYVDSSIVNSEQYIRKYDVIIVSSTGSTKVIGRAGISKATYDKVAFGAFLTLVRPRNWINKRYLDLFFLSDLYRNRIQKLASGVNINNIRIGYILESPIPLPPLPEQQRIVSHIENLFPKLDEAKEKLQEVIDGFETRKAAILHKAFTGELTKKWREEHGVRMDSWKDFELKKISKIGSGGTPSRKIPDYFNGTISWIKTGEINWNVIRNSEESISGDAIDNSSAKVYPKGTVVVAMYGQGLTRGRAAILGIEAATNQAVCALQPNEFVNNYYLFYYFMEHYWDYRQKAFGGNQPNYSATMIASWIINLPSLNEQEEIVRIIESLLTKEQAAKDTAEQTLEQIDLIQKSILARAFRGELGTNDPNEPSSIELLRQAIADNQNS